LLFFLGLPALFISTDRVNRACAYWSRGVVKLAQFFIGIDYNVSGLDKLPKDGCYIVASKHQSMWDTFFLVGHIPRSVVVFKQELRFIPFFGTYITRSGGIVVDRSESTVALRKLLRAALRTKTEGRPIIIFPEGTRVAFGHTPPLKSGVVALNKQLAVPTVPVFLDSGRLWGKGQFVKTPGRIRVVFHKPIPPGLSRKDYTSRLHRLINSPDDDKA